MPALDVVLPGFLILIASLSVHEAAHAWAADRLGDPTARLLGRLTLNPLSHIDWLGTVLLPFMMVAAGLPPLGWAKPVPVDTRNLVAPRRDFALVALAGPVSNVALASVGLVVLLAMGGLIPEGGPTYTGVLLYQAIFVNLLLAGFNMIPIPPLDGGNVVAGVVPESVARLLEVVRPFGFVVIYALIWFGVVDYIETPIERLLGWLVL